MRFWRPPNRPRGLIKNNLVKYDDRYKPEAPAKEAGFLRWRFRLVWRHTMVIDQFILEQSLTRPSRNELATTQNQSG